MKQHIFIFLILITVFTSCKVAVTRDLDAQIVPEQFVHWTKANLFFLLKRLLQ